MHPPSSSTSSSERSRKSPAIRETITIALWFLISIAIFELMVWFSFTHTPLREGSLQTYFWHGQSYEGKLRQLAHTPNPPPRSLIFAGWINKEVLQDSPTDVDVTVYGSSFSGNVATSMKELRPQIRLRFLGGPGAPLNHTYGLYELDRTLRKTRVAVIGVVSETVGQVLTMNIGSIYPELVMPYFYPRYDLANGRIERTGESLMNSREEFVRGIDDPDLWRRQLDILSVHDDAYRRWFFAADAFDLSAIARLVRRGFAKSHTDRYLAEIYDRNGYRRDAYAVQVFRALLGRMIDDSREEGVKPIVVLFATNGYEDHLHALLVDLLSERKVPFVNTFDVCRSTDRRSYIPDGHFTQECDLKTAKRVLELMDATLAGEGR
jgi:hypothetical protein